MRTSAPNGGQKGLIEELIVLKTINDLHDNQLSQMARHVGLELRAQCPVDEQKYANKPRSESDILSNKIDTVLDKINEVGSKT